MSIIMERRVCIGHGYLNKDIKDVILDKIRENTKDECSKEFGYILNINKIVKIVDNYISNVNCENVFIVLFEAEVLKPENGKTFSGVVCMIFNGGIFLNIKNKQKILIPLMSLTKYTFDQTNKCFKSKTEKDKIIKEGSILDVVITGTKYSKKTFSCFGNLIENEN